MLKIYFAGSIRGGREDLALYLEIIGYLQSKGIVLTEHIGDKDLTSSGEAALSDREIYTRDLEWLTSADCVVAEVSTPSLGVGFEIAKAIGMQKPVICLCRKNSERRLSAMIAGCESLSVVWYANMHDARLALDAFFG